MNSTVEQPVKEQPAAGKPATIEGLDLSAYDPNDYGWFQLVQRSGDAGEAWVADFQESKLYDLVNRCNASMIKLRTGKRDEGKADLDKVREELKDIETQQPDVPALVVHRWLYGADAFVSYLEGNFEAALEELAICETAVQKTLGKFEFLKPLAFQILDLQFQRARVARKERRWEDLHEAIEAAREMVSDKRPLVVLEDGREVFSRTVVDFYRSFDLSEEETSLLEYFYEPQRYLERFSWNASRIDMPAGFVVPYQ
ncbi:MAG: hypothetical protein AAGM22_09220 [Acidobacteriota bacterium]